MHSSTGKLIAFLGLALAPALAVAAGREALPAVSLVSRSDLMMRDNRTREPYYFEVAAPVIVDGRILAPKGSIAVGEIVAIAGKGSVANKGDLAVRLLFLSAPSGAIRLMATSRDGLLHGDGTWLRSGTMVTARIAQDIAFRGDGHPTNIALASR